MAYVFHAANFLGNGTVLGNVDDGRTGVDTGLCVNEDLLVVARCCNLSSLISA